MGALRVFGEALTVPPKRANAIHDVVLKEDVLSEYVRKQGMRGRLAPKNVGVQKI